MSDEKKRILKLVAEGKISASEAEMLLDALEDRQDQTGNGANSQAKPFKLDIDLDIDSDTPKSAQSKQFFFWHHNSPTPPVPPTAPVPPQGFSFSFSDDGPRSQGKQGTPQEKPQGLRAWFRLHLNVSNATIRVRDDLKHPLVNGETLEISPEGYAVSAFSKKKFKFAWGQVNIQGDRGKREDETSFLLDDLDIELPRDVGLWLELAAGQVHASGLCYLKGRASGSQLILKEVRGLDLDVNAGQFEATLDLSPGMHRLQGNAADIQLSSLGPLNIRGRAVMSGLDVPEGIEVRTKLVKSEFWGVLGDWQEGGAGLGLELRASKLSLDQAKAENIAENMDKNTAQEPQSQEVKPDQDRPSS
ncbi:MAG: hypothetical protein R2880_20080 [Deinococcales bacterium]